MACPVSTLAEHDSGGLRQQMISRTQTDTIVVPLKGSGFKYNPSLSKTQQSFLKQNEISLLEKQIYTVLHMATLQMPWHCILVEDSGLLQS